MVKGLHDDVSELKSLFDSCNSGVQSHVMKDGFQPSFRECTVWIGEEKVTFWIYLFC